MNTAPSPFSCTYSPNIPELLSQLQCSLGISTYQAGKFIFLSPKGEEALTQLPRTFDKPMGIAISQEGDQMALACKGEAIVFRNSPGLAANYPKAVNTYDSMFMPRMRLNTSYIDVHDLSFGNDGLYAVNTLFSCISRLDDQYDFTPVWFPPFIDDLVSEDRCHLNGMAMKNGVPKYVTCFNNGNSFRSWRSTIPGGGLVIDVETNEIIAKDLSMPHSPMLINDQLYVLESATGDLTHIDTQTGKKNQVLNLGGFVRGMTYYNGFLFVGLSKIRKNSSSFGKLEISEKANHSGIVAIHLERAAIWGEIKYQSSVDEIYDLAVFTNKLRPNILNPDNDIINLGITTPEKTFWAKLDQ